MFMKTTSLLAVLCSICCVSTETFADNQFAVIPREFALSTSESVQHLLAQQVVGEDFAAQLVEVVEWSSSDATVARVSDSGIVPRPVRLGRTLRWRRDELLAWVRNGCPKERQPRRGRRKRTR